MDIFYFNTRVYDKDNNLIFCNNYNSTYENIFKMQYDVQKQLEYRPEIAIKQQKDGADIEFLDLNGYLHEKGYRFITEVIQNK